MPPPSDPGALLKWHREKKTLKKTSERSSVGRSGVIYDRGATFCHGGDNTLHTGLSEARSIWGMQKAFFPQSQHSATQRRRNTPSDLQPRVEITLGALKCGGFIQIFGHVQSFFVLMLKSELHRESSCAFKMIILHKTIQMEKVPAVSRSHPAMQKQPSSVLDLSSKHALRYYWL